MRKPAFLAALGTTLVMLAAAQQPSPRPSRYEQLAARVRRGDKTVNFRDLRMAYTETLDYESYDASEAHESMLAALDDKRYPAALQLASSVLNRDFVDIDAHYASYVAYRELGDQERAAFHKQVVDGLLRSIADSGDGKSVDSAFVVIEPREEMLVWQFLGAGEPTVSSLEKNGHHFDVLKGQDARTFRTVTYFFNVDKPWNRGRGQPAK